MNKCDIIVSSYMFSSEQLYRETIEKYIELGISTIRVNCTRFSYEKYAKHIETIRRLFWEIGEIEAKIILDLPFPGEKIRVEYDGKEDKIPFARGDRFLIVSDKKRMNILKRVLYIADDGFIQECNYQDRLIFGDGESSFLVLSKKDGELTVEAINSGVLKYRKSLYGKHAFFKKSTNCEEVFGFIQRVNPYGVAFSFLEDIKDIGVDVEWFEKRKIEIIPKIETKRAVENLDKICIDGINQIMLGRGDLAITAGYREFAKLQNQVISYCLKKRVEIIAATDILSSIDTQELIPERSNLTDIYYLLTNGIKSFCASAYVSKDITKISRFQEMINTIEL